MANGESSTRRRGDGGSGRAEVLRLRGGRQRHPGSGRAADPAAPRCGHLSVGDRAAADLARARRCGSSKTPWSATACSAWWRRRTPKTRTGERGPLLAGDGGPHPQNAEVSGRQRPHSGAGAAADRGPAVRQAGAVLHRAGPPPDRYLRVVERPRGGAGPHGAPVRQVRLDDPVPSRRAAGGRDEHQIRGR